MLHTHRKPWGVIKERPYLITCSISDGRPDKPASLGEMRAAIPSKIEDADRREQETVNKNP